jgi:Tfp pilus assembly protein PilF
MFQGLGMSAEMDRTVALSRAVTALAEGADAKAGEIAEALLRRWPEDAGVQQLMAVVALRQSKPAEAERWALSSLAARPDHAATLVLAAAAARAQRHWPDAIARYARAVELEPTRSEAAFGATVAAIAIDPANARASVAALRQRFPEPSSAWAEVGAALERHGLWELAAQALALALKAQPSAKLSLRLGAALQALGRRGEAAERYQEALRLEPGSAEAWFKLGLAFQDSRHPDRAEKAYRRALSLRPDLAEAEANLGVVLQEQGDLEGAKQAYGRAIELMPAAFGRVAQALTTAPTGELWLDLSGLRAHLLELGRLSR